MKTVKVLIADDHSLFLDGIVSLLETEEFHIDTAHDGIEVMEKMATCEYEVCLLDIGMPNMDGIATAKALKERKSPVKIIILSTYNDKEIITEMLKIGVSGYLLKNCSRQELLEAIQEVMAGGKYFSDDVQRAHVNQFTTYFGQKNKAEQILTPREIEIVQLLAREYTNEKIADKLNISFRTVETHRKNIMQKTKAHNLAGLLKFAYDQGIQ